MSREGLQETMPCVATNKDISTLKQEGWEYLYSFHGRIPEQWSLACGEARKALQDGFYEVVRVLGQDDPERKDDVQYLYKRKTQRLLDVEKELGY